MLFCISSAGGMLGSARARAAYVGVRYTLVRCNHSGSRTVRPLVICGPSGVGKSTLIKRVMRENKDLFGFSVSHTTRLPRPGEEHGVDYHFVSKEEMTDAIGKGEFLEYAEVHGNLYGTSVAAVKRVHHSGKICVLDIDVQGVKSFKAHDVAKELNPLFVFIAPPSVQELTRRLIHRGTETPQALERRIAKATEELEFGTTAGNFDAVIVNSDLDEANEELETKLHQWFEGFTPKTSNKLGSTVK